MSKPTRFFSIFTFAVAAATAGAMWRYVDGFGPLLSWLIAITVVTFLTYGYDKMVSSREATRVPESVLLLLAFVGGTAGAITGMHLFHHKTVKSSFRWKFWLLFALQVLLVSGYYIWLKPRFEA